uniref:PDZ domain-containing protein n=1 Tax=Cyanistes caeruleus TaxID=156563 RepID=A0A8C0UU78_CYACU
MQNTPDSTFVSVCGLCVISFTAFDTASCSLKEIHLVKAGGPLGLSIVGGSDHSSHPFGIHEPGVSSSGAAARDGRLKVGMRILEVNHQSLLGMTHTEAVQILRGVGDALLVLVCDGFDPKAAAAIEVSAGVQVPLESPESPHMDPTSFFTEHWIFPTFCCKFFWFFEVPDFRV